MGGNKGKTTNRRRSCGPLNLVGQDDPLLPTIFLSNLEFDIKILPYTGDPSWVEQTILDSIECLKGDELPLPGEDCDFCKYREAVSAFEK